MPGRPRVTSEETVRRLADLEAIRDLARRYAHFVWQGDIPSAIGLFAEDGEMNTGGRPPIVGRENLLRVYGEMLGDAMFHPFVHNHVIELDGDRATGTVYLDLRAIQEGRSVMGSGFYEDRYVRIDGDWRFQSRRLNMCYLVPPGEDWSQ